MKQAVYGREHPAVAITLGNLGIMQHQLGQLEKASGRKPGRKRDTGAHM
jgi:hypothetical protein